MSLLETVEFPSRGHDSAVATGPIRSEYADVPQVARVLGDYVDGLPATVGRMSAFLAGSKREELRRVAHQLKGTGGSYGFSDITRLAGEVESVIDHGGRPDEIAGAVASLIDLMRRVDGYDRSAEASPMQSSGRV